MDLNHPHHATHVRVAVFATAFAMTLAFHWFLAERWYGLGAALFFIVVVIGVHVVDIFAAKPNNTWAYIFLVPLFVCGAAEIIYASSVVRLIALPLMLVSAALFAYWFSAPRIGFWQAPVIWPAAAVAETLWPFRGSKEMVSGLGKSDRWTSVLYGLLVALPLLTIIGGLFAKADPLFNKALTDIFQLNDLEKNVWRVLRDIFAAIYFACAGWTVYTRTRDARAAKPGSAATAFDQTMLATILGALNILFIAFIVVQVAAFFGGATFVQAQGIGYADYARSGFFQLLAVAGIIFALLVVIYRATHLQQWGTRLLSLTLIAETGIVIASAIRRLLLYIDAYGMTLSRYWAMTVIIIIAVVLAVMAIGALAKLKYAPLAKAVFVGLLVIFPLMLLYNTEGYIVRFNADRFLTEKTDRLDLAYLENDLSVDALPALSELFSANWPGQPLSPTPQPALNNINATNGSAVYKVYSRDDLRKFLSARHAELGKSIQGDWRKMTVMDYYAFAATAEF